jgi:hypothetical protein
MPAGAKRMPLRRLLCRRCAEAFLSGRCGSGRCGSGCEVGMACKSWRAFGMPDSNMGGEDVCRRRMEDGRHELVQKETLQQHNTANSNRIYRNFVIAANMKAAAALHHALIHKHCHRLPSGLTRLTKGRSADLTLRPKSTAQQCRRMYYCRPEDVH